MIAIPTPTPKNPVGTKAANTLEIRARTGERGSLGRLTAVAVVLAVLIPGAVAAQVEAPKTFGDAIRWYPKAAEAGSPEAQFLLGLQFETGSGRVASAREAVRWFKRAAEAGHPLAQFKFATALHYGAGTEPDLPAAADWYRRAAENGVHEAAFNLGFVLEQGLAAIADAKAATKWYRQAAEAGLAPAQLNLGVLYIQGEGVEPNLVEAWVWFNLAASKDQAQAAVFRGRLDLMMSEEQRQRARAVAKERRSPLGVGQAQ